MNAWRKNASSIQRQTARTGSLRERWRSKEKRLTLMLHGAVDVVEIAELRLAAKAKGPLLELFKAKPFNIVIGGLGERCVRLCEMGAADGRDIKAATAKSRDR